jgi:hypothetical protein
MSDSPDPTTSPILPSSALTAALAGTAEPLFSGLPIPIVLGFPTLGLPAKRRRGRSSRASLIATLLGDLPPTAASLELLRAEDRGKQEARLKRAHRRGSRRTVQRLLADFAEWLGRRAVPVTPPVTSARNRP